MVEKIKVKGLKAIEKDLQRFVVPSIKAEIGWFENSRYDNPQKTPVAAVAQMNEFGGPNRPARPFIRQTVRKDKMKWAGIVRQVFSDTLLPKLALKSASVAAQRDLIGTIFQGGFAPNSPSTIKQKGFNRPLIDTGKMWQEITFEVTAL